MTTDTIVSKTERPNSFEMGKAGARFKLYFEDAKDLKNMLEELKSYELWTDEVPTA